MTLGHSAYTGGGIIPKGGIIMWSGTIATIPFGWALCDGNNGTPNLIDKFVICAKQDDTVSKTNVTGSLTQTGGVAEVTLTGAQSGIASHTHGIKLGDTLGGTTYVEHSLTNNQGTTATEAAGPTDAAEAHTNLPPYYALAFIQKM